MFSPLSYHTIRLRRRFGWLLVVTSLLLHAVTVLAYSRQPDKLAAFTVWPLWIWGLLGLALAGFAMVALRASFALVVSMIWVLTLVLGCDEAKWLINIGRVPPSPALVATFEGKSAIRIVSLNCRNFSVGNPSADLLDWNADIMMLQEIHPYSVKAICDKAYQGKGHYRVHKTNGIISRWPITMDHRLDGFRDQYVMVGLPDSSKLQVVNVHLSSAATNMRLWQKDCWKTHAANRVERRFELGSILQRLESIASPAVYPVIIGGDFNAQSQDATFRLMNRDFTDAFLHCGTGWGHTFPRSMPVMRIDHIFTSKHLLPVRAKVMPTQHSDHRILIVDVIRKNP